jgi:hypothetical protein
VPKKDIVELYIRDPYYIVPDGELGGKPSRLSAKQFVRWASLVSAKLSSHRANTSSRWKRVARARGHHVAVSKGLTGIVGRMMNVGLHHRGVDPQLAAILNAEFHGGFTGPDAAFDF